MEGPGLALLVFGGIVAIVGGIITLVGLKNWNRRKRIVATPTSPIAQAPGGAMVEIKGRIAPSEQGVVQAPFSGRHCVWVRITVQELRSSGRNTYWHTLLSEIDGRPFLVDDGSGQMARVIAQGANVILDQQNIATSGTFNDAPPQLNAFLASRGISSTSWLGFNKSMRYNEEVLAPGEPLYALGPSRRDAGPPVNDGYRMVPGTQLVMFAMPGPLGELILTNKSEQELVGRLAWGFIGGLVTGGIGVAMALGGVVVAILENL
jgi:hypothetical protein